MNVMALSWPWATLEDEKQHCFRYSREQINISLCGKWTALDQNGWIVQVGCMPHEDLDESNCCTECLKIKEESI